uniref:Uncharacterized protein n=1 Tax=Panagrolaimus sp. JU765 TaxID=591449 RepID=A0AC34QZM0_9BILA
MPKPTTLAEWQLQAVLFHAKLTQYYQKFISLGGDDVDQLMQSDESEFLEIMKLIGMASKPLHVRRFQRTLQEFSRDRTAFLQQAVTNIGPPPIDFPTTSTTTPMQAALQFLLPHTSTGSTTTTTTTGTTSDVLSPPKLTTTSFFQTSPSSLSATASLLPITGVDLLNLVSTNPFVSLPSTSPIIPSTSIAGTSQLPTRRSTSRTQSPAIGASNIASPSSESEYPTDQPFEGGILPENDIPIIQQLSKHLYDSIPNLKNLEPRYVQNKKRLPKELLDVMTMPTNDSTRIIKFRQFSAIYGRYDAKRKPDKPLSYHELLVNEAAAQLCLLQPVLLTRRDELFPLARKVVRASNFSNYRTISTTNIEKKKQIERSQTPESNPSNRSSPEISTSDRKRSSSTTDVKPSTSEPETKKSKNE